MNGRSHTRITHSLTNDLAHSLGPGHSAPPRPSAPAHTFITHKKTNDKLLPFFSLDFSINPVGKIGSLSPNEEFLCNLFINNRLQALLKNYPPSLDWFPPYGIRFGSNWQMSLKTNKMAHESKDEQCSGEPEMIKAFRDTWELGIHSYLTYLRDRLIIARELLSQSGSVFVQISDENVHLEL